MQLDRSRDLLFYAAMTAACHYGIFFFSGGSIPGSIANLVCVVLGWFFGTNAIDLLGGNLLSPSLDDGGYPLIQKMPRWAFWLTMFMPIVLIALAYADPHALAIIDLLCGICIGIRLIQWNGFEPNGLAEFEPAAH
ncbi:MAG: hypothetical protein JWN49_623 [Parcubacteria group bacterium]|nr:hypothetical protein [Parcubacteria group bacterium]